MVEIENPNFVDPVFMFYDLNGNLINASSMTFDSSGKPDTVTTENGDVFEKGQYTYTAESLYIDGIGYLVKGDIVKLTISSVTEYELNYGWHTNVSNQTIYSWYLKPVVVPDYWQDEKSCLNDDTVASKQDIGILTFYKQYLETIEVVRFVKDRPTI